jgi:hypothetical protein
MLQFRQSLVPLKRQITELEYIIARSDIKSWVAVQEIVRAGLASKAFNIGDQFLADYNGSPVAWDVIGIDHDTPTDTQFTHSLSIQAHDCLLNVQFDAPEALYYAEAELAAGAYTFNDGTADYTFTLGSAIPAGGQAVLTWAGTPAIPAEIKTYPTKVSTEAIETVAVTAGATGTVLTPINDLGRAKNGSNNYVESNIREWLNSEANQYVWSPKTKWDRPSTGSPYTGAGFLSLLDPELVAVIGLVDKQVARNTVTDEGGQDSFSDKAFLLSGVEVGFETEGTTTGESVYPYYSGVTDAGRIKLLSDSPRHWWLRSPTIGISSSARYVYSSGILSSNSAFNVFGLSPACCIV